MSSIGPSAAILARELIQFGRDGREQQPQI